MNLKMKALSSIEMSMGVDLTMCEWLIGRRTDTTLYM
jgi:hypothetical protein